MHIEVRVTPSASVSAIVGYRDGVLRVRVAAPPVDGKANRELLRILASALDLPPTSLSIVRGQTSKRKTIVVPLNLQQLADRLTAYL